MLTAATQPSSLRISLRVTRYALLERWDSGKAREVGRDRGAKQPDQDENPDRRLRPVRADQKKRRHQPEQDRRGRDRYRRAAVGFHAHEPEVLEMRPDCEQ